MNNFECSGSKSQNERISVELYNIRAIYTRENEKRVSLDARLARSRPLMSS